MRLRRQLKCRMWFVRARNTKLWEGRQDGDSFFAFLSATRVTEKLCRSVCTPIYEVWLLNNEAIKLEIRRVQMRE